jgi:hypothetical protein
LSIKNRAAITSMAPRIAVGVFVGVGSSPIIVTYKATTRSVVIPMSSLISRLIVSLSFGADKLA